MSHCIACDRLLTDKEAARKHRDTNEEIGLCNNCLSEVLSIQAIPLKDSLYDDAPMGTNELEALLDDYNDLARTQDHLDGLE